VANVVAKLKRLQSDERSISQTINYLCLRVRRGQLLLLTVAAAQRCQCFCAGQAASRHSIG
jgi:hypothetical protein